MQLTTDKARADAHRVCERLGSVASHEGLELLLRAARRPAASLRAPAGRSGGAGS